MQPPVPTSARPRLSWRPAVQRVALEEMDLPYEIVGMDHPAHDLDEPEFRAKNPFGQLPVIDDDGVVVTESGAILLRARCTERPAWKKTLDAYFERVETG